MEENEKTEKQKEKEAAQKTGQLAARGVADYYTKGEYEKYRSMPIVGGALKGAEKKIGRKVARADRMAGGMGGKVSKKLDDAGVLDTADQALNTFGGAMGGKGGGGGANMASSGGSNFNSGKGFGSGGHNAQDVSAINNRKGVNGNSLGKKDGLEKKGGLDSDGLDPKKDGISEGDAKKDGIKSKNNKEDSVKNKDTKKDGLKDKDEINKKNRETTGDKKGGLLQGKINSIKLKIKIALILIGIAAAAFILFFAVSFIAWGFDKIWGSIASFFGVSEADSREVTTIDEADGLLTSEEYMINPSTGEQYTTEELVDYLKSDGTCKTTTLNKIVDWFDSLFDDEYRDYCGYYRYISKYIEKKEEKYSVTLDRGLIVSSLFYGFASQIDYSDYAKNVDLEKVDEITNAYHHYDSLTSIIEAKGVLNKNNVTTMIDASMLDESHTYYTWEVEDKTDDDGNVTKKTGKCVANDADYAHYSALKWSILMRFGEEAATMYEDELKYNHSFNSSDDECKMGMTDDELKERIKGSSEDDSITIVIDSSVRTANNKFANQREASDLSPFEQKANTETSTADYFDSYQDLELTYRNGFAFKNFPSFEKAFDSQYIELSYDYVVTPKQIEEVIQNILYNKTDVNYYLNYTDLDSNTYSQIGNYVIGANCEPYLTAAPDAIQVKVTDCDGSYIRTTSFKDYIMGVAYGEVSDSGDNYVLSEMVAAISYSLHRRNNYLKGSTITMRSGNCDQVYCPMGEGCTSRKANLSCGSFKCTSYYPGGGNYHRAASQSLQEKYANYYETAKNYLVVSNGKPHSAHYVSSIQLGWKEKANRGMPFTQIIQEEYQDEGAQLIKCGAENETSTDDEITEQPPGTKVGNVATADYPSVSPDYGKFYGFAYNEEPEGRDITINPEWKKANIGTIKSNCPSVNWSQSFSINKAANTNFSNALKNICNLLTNGVTLSDGKYCKLSVSQLKDGGTFVSRKTSSGNYSLHAYGIAQDWNYSLKITYNGKTYAPYASQGASTKAEYDRFVAALGKEESCENVNYILWKYAYQPAGFTWGGDWGANSWDGMHFQVKY